MTEFSGLLMRIYVRLPAVATGMWSRLMIETKSLVRMEGILFLQQNYFLTKDSVNLLKSQRWFKLPSFK